MAIEVRELTGDDWKVRRDLRLAALLDAPEAFYSTYEQNRDRDEVGWREWPSRGALFGAWLVGEPVGLVGIAPDRHDPPGGGADLFAMWVAPSGRGTGVADALIRSALAWAAAAGLTEVGLEVAPGNGRAERVYARHGFRRTDERPMIAGGMVMRFRVVTSHVGAAGDPILGP